LTLADCCECLLGRLPDVRVKPRLNVVFDASKAVGTFIAKMRVQGFEYMRQKVLHLVVERKVLPSGVL